MAILYIVDPILLTSVIESLYMEVQNEKVTKDTVVAFFEAELPTITDDLSVSYAELELVRWGTVAGLFVRISYRVLGLLHVWALRNIPSHTLENDPPVGFGRSKFSSRELKARRRARGCSWFVNGGGMKSIPIHI